MRAVSHPNVLDIEEVYEGDNNIYCLGKLYAGENLSKIISDKRMPISEETVFNVAHKLINVDYGHTEGTRLPRGEKYHTSRYKTRECCVF
jgi:hypothetical protein